LRVLNDAHTSCLERGAQLGGDDPHARGPIVRLQIIRFLLLIQFLFLLLRLPLHLLILRRILEKNPQAHILLLDVHREYAQSFKGMSEVIAPDNMVLPFWLLNFEESVEILIGQQPGRETDVEILRELIPQAKARYMNNQRRDKNGATPRGSLFDGSNIGVDTPLPYRTSDLTGILEEYIGKLELRGELAPYKRLKARIETISRDPRYGFMFGSLTVQDNMASVLARLFRIPVSGKPIRIKDGRFGAYVTDGVTNATISRGESIDEIDFDRAVQMLADKRAKGPAVPAISRWT